jgi:hypothetical protein
MKNKLPRFSGDTNPMRKGGGIGEYPRLPFGLVVLLQLVASAMFVVTAFSQERPKTSNYGKGRVVARVENEPPQKKEIESNRGRGGEGGEPLPTPLTAEERDGRKLVELATKDVFRQRAIEAKVRQRVFAFGQEVTGAGDYFQFGSGQPKLLRLEMKMQIGPQAATLLQICGRQDYWIRRHIPPGAPKLEHVKLTRLASALSRHDDDERSFSADHWILLGGLSRLLESLHRNFDFGPPRPDHIGDTQILVLDGRLKPERFKELHLAGKSESDIAVEQLPTAVKLSLGRSDQEPPHFPYRIEYLRQLSAKELKAAAKKTPTGTQPTSETPLCILEFDEVRSHIDLDPQLFEFNPGDEEYEDRTQAWVQKLKR